MIVVVDNPKTWLLAKDAARQTGDQIIVVTARDKDDLLYTVNDGGELTGPMRVSYQHKYNVRAPYQDRSGRGW